MFTQGKLIEHKDYGWIFESDIEWFKKYVRPTDITTDKTDNSENKLHTNFYPEQIVGDPNNSRIYLLNMNPSFDASNQITLPPIQPTILDNIINRFGDYPFYCLNPEFDFSDGNDWWRNGNHFKSWEKEFSREKLAKSFCCLELLPYHCKKLPARIKNHITDCPSVKAIIDFVHTSILSKAKLGENSIILLRCEKEWNITEDPTNNIFFTSSRRSAYFGAKMYTNTDTEKRKLFYESISRKIY